MATAKDKKDAKAKEDAKKGGKGQGRAIMMPDGKTRRVDYIKDQFYNKNVKRGDIARALTETFKKPIPYQIVFAATKLSPEEHAKAAKEAAKK